MKLQMKNIMNKMFNTNVENVIYDLFTGRVGIKDGDTTYTFKRTETELPKVDNLDPSKMVSTTKTTWAIEENSFETFTMPMKAFAIKTNIDDIKEGDIVLDSKGLVSGCVIGLDLNSVTVLKTNQEEVKINPSTNVLLGGEKSLMVVKDITNMAGFKPMGSNPTSSGGMDFQQMLPMLMMANGEESSMEDMLPMLMMSGMVGSNNSQQNPMQMMFMMQMMGKGDSSMEDMLPLMMMGGMMGGEQQNPMLMMLMMNQLGK